MSSTNDRLKRFADKHGADLDTLTLEEYEALNRDLKKADALATKGIEERATEIRAEAADRLDADDVPAAPDGADPDDGVETLSKTACAAALERALSDDFDLEALHTRHRVEERIETLKRKRRTFESRGVTSRVEGLNEEIAALKAAHDEAAAATGTYSDVDTLASRATRDGLVLSVNDDGSLAVRETGGGDE